ncbi:hypothetical protein GCM10010149_89180 [Nonomuraea roseoviolacea subsp. roseoviolacea]|uniref:hypothetical protein n=1 Tax=Nonomuraea roseoviolacea TaxID=103837 RepID=UPI0031CDF75F
MATYPGDIRVLPTKRDFSQTIIESHMNDIQTELVAAEKIFGVNPHIATANPGNLVRDYITVTNRITSMVRGEHLPYYQSAVLDYKLHTTSQASNPQVPDKDPDGNDLDWCGTQKRQRARQLTLASGEQVWLPYYYNVINRDGDDEPWVGLPMEQDEQSTADGGWQRLPFLGEDDPFGMGLVDGIKLNQTGLWMINLRVDHRATEDSTAVRARHRARLEINGRDATLQHLVRENADNTGFITNYVAWVEVLKAGTVITASARVDGTDLTDDISVNAFLRAHLIRCTEEEDDGMLKDFPDTIYTPPPPPPPRAPSVPPTPTPGRPNTNYPSGGSIDRTPYAVEIRPGEWYGYYGWGTVGPQSSPYFVGIGQIGGSNI